MAFAHHTLDIYGAELWLARTAREWATLRRRLPFLGDRPNSAGWCRFAVWVPKDTGPSVPVIVFWIDPKANVDPLELVDTCAHEATHAAGALMEHLGHDHRGIDEPSAYLVGWLTRWLYEHATD